MTQGQFLELYGIQKRSKILAANLIDVDREVNRLVNKDQMGSIYKVLEFSRK